MSHLRNRSGSRVVSGRRGSMVGSRIGNVNKRGSCGIEGGEDVLSPSHCVAYGPALAGSIVKQRTKFYIEARNSSGSQLTSGSSAADWKLEILRLGSENLPKEFIDPLNDRGDGTYEVSFVPDIPGDYVIDVRYHELPIQGSPFKTKVYLDAASTYLVKCYLQIDDFKEEEAGNAEVKIHVTGPDGVSQLANHSNLGGGRFAMSYTPTDIGDYVLDAYVNGKQAAGCPYVVSFQGDPNLKMLDPGRSIAYGPGLMDSYVGDQLYFLVEARNVYDQTMKDLKAGTVRCEVKFHAEDPNVDPDSLPVATVSDNGDGTFSVDYVSGPVAGKYRLDVNLNGESVAFAPFRVRFKSDEPIPEPVVEKPATQPREPVVLPKKETTIDYQALCRGLGLRGAVVDVETEFLVELYDQYANPALMSDLSLLKATVKPHGNSKGEPEAQIVIEHAPEEAQKKGFAGSVVRVKYVPKHVGEALVHLELQGKPVDRFPRTIQVQRNTTVYGPALEEPMRTGQTAVIIVESFGADGERAGKGGGKVEATVTGPSKEKITANIADNHDGTYLVQFSTKSEGHYDVQLSFNGRKVHGSPFLVEALPPNYRVVMEGKGLSSAYVGKPASFTVEVRELPNKKITLTSTRLRAILHHPDSSNRTTEIDVRIRPDGTAELTYTPELEGNQMIEITLDGSPLEGTPLSVIAAPPPTPRRKRKAVAVSKCRASGPGLKKAVMCEASCFSIELRDEEGELFDPTLEGHEVPEITVDIVGPKGGVVGSTKLTPSSNPAIIDVSYVPLNTGVYTGYIHINGTALNQSPFTVLCSRQPTDPSKCVATGPGLSDMIAYGEKPNTYKKQKARFFIEARDSKGRQVKGGKDDVKVTIRGKSVNGKDVTVSDVSVTDGGNGCYTVEYLPEEYGDYEISVTINGSPMPDLTKRKVRVKKGTYNIQVSGTGFSEEKQAEPSSFLTVGELADLKVHVEPETASSDDSAELPEGLVVLKVLGDDGKELEVTVDENMGSWGDLLGQYQPSKKGKYTIQVFVDGSKQFEKQLVCDRSQVDPSKTICYGPGVEGVVVVNAITNFTVETRDKFGNAISSDSNCQVVIEELMHEAISVGGKPKYNTIEAKVQDNHDGTFSVSYNPKNKGRHAIQVLIDGVSIGSGSPDDNKIIVEAVPATYNVKFNTDHSEAIAYQPNDFIISLEDTLGVPLKDKKPVVAIRAPDGNTTSYAQVDFTDTPGSFKVTYTPNSVGNHIIDVQVEGKSVGNPKIVKAVAKVDVSKTVLHNIAEVQAGTSRQFQLELYDASGQRLQRGGDKVEVVIQDEKGSTVKSTLKDNNNGLYSVQFPELPPGKYEIKATVNGERVPETPVIFMVTTLPYDFEARGVGVIGGRVAPLVDFFIDVTTKESRARVKAEKVSFQVAIIGPGGDVLVPKVSETRDDSLQISYPALQDGSYQVRVSFNKIVLPTFPRTVDFSGKKANNRQSVIRDAKQTLNLQLQRDDEVFLGDEFKTLRFGLGWSTTEEIDLDGSCVLLRYTTKMDHAFFRDMKTLDGSVIHTGDNRKGGDGVKDDEQIVVNLNKINPKINTLVFVVNVFDEGKSFAQVQNAYVRLTNDLNGRELCRYTLTNCATGTALIMAKLSRFGSLWKLRAIGQSASGHTFDRTLPEILPFLDRSAPKRNFEVRVHEARGLVSNQQVNPYFMLRYDTTKEISRVLKTTSTPKWQQLIKIKGEDELLEVTVYNKTSKSSEGDEVLGRLSIPLPKETPRISFGPVWYPLLKSPVNPAANGELCITVAQIL